MQKQYLYIDLSSVTLQSERERLQEEQGLGILHIVEAANPEQGRSAYVARCGFKANPDFNEIRLSEHHAFGVPKCEHCFSCR